MNTKKKKIVLIVVLSIIGLIVIPLIVLGGIYFFSPKSHPKYVAHRGLNGKYVGNTEDSFRAAAETEGFYGIETDVRKTKDGVYVCNHDETVKYASGEEKKVSDTLYDELIASPLKNDKTEKDVYLCTFENYLKICKSGNKIAVIELKEDFGIEDLREILALVDENYDREHISVISFDYAPLLRVKEEDPSIPLQYLSETKDDPLFDRCIKDGISIDVRQSILTKSMVNKFHEAGLSVNTWTVNKKFDLNIVRIKGVDYVTTDFFSED